MRGLPQPGEEGWGASFVRSLMSHGLLIVLPVALAFLLVLKVPQAPSWVAEVVSSIAGVCALSATIAVMRWCPGLIVSVPPELRWQVFGYSLWEALSPTLLLASSVVAGFVVRHGEFGAAPQSISRIALIAMAIEAAILGGLTLLALRRAP